MNTKVNDEELEEEIDLSTGGEGGGDGSEAEDRGDNVNPEVTEQNLRRVAGAGAATGAEEEEEEEEEEEAAGGGDSPMIPKSRLNKALKARDDERDLRIRAEERSRVLQEQLEKSGGGKGQEQQAGQETNTVDLKALRKKKNQALVDGDLDLAEELEEQLENHIRESARAEAVAEVTSQNATAIFNEAVAEVIEAYPFLNSKAKDKNLDAIDEVVALRNHYITKDNLSAAAALRKAADKVGPRYAKAAGKGNEGEEEEDAGKGGGSQQESQAALRKKLSLRRNADAASRQPAQMNGGDGERSTAGKVDVSELPDEDFSKLTPKQKKEARGDNF
ncbi:MAG: hypothetical protein V4607_02070 [Pseudomonadota bacterium]